MMKNTVKEIASAVATLITDSNAENAILFDNEKKTITGADVMAWFETKMAQATRTAERAKARKAEKTNEANISIMDEITTILTVASNPMTRDEVAEQLDGVSPTKVSLLVGKMDNVEKVKIKMNGKARTAYVLKSNEAEAMPEEASC